MKVLIVLTTTILAFAAQINALSADVIGEDRDASGSAMTGPEAVRVTILRMGGVDHVQAVSGGSPGDGCAWSARPGQVTGPNDHLATGTSPDEMHTLYVVFCDGTFHGYAWIGPDDVVDLDALAGGEAARYVEDVLAPGVSIGVNPDARGLVGLRSWFWVEGFDGAAVTVPVAALGLTVNVQLSMGSVSWDFGDGTVESGSLGEAYPAESSVQHAHQADGTYDVSVSIELLASYSVDGGPPLELAPLTIGASTEHPVEQRQAIIHSR